jgi:hypothetical protein
VNKDTKEKSSITAVEIKSGFLIGKGMSGG